MPILKLLAQLGLDKTGFDAGITAASKSVNKFGAGLKTQLAGAFGAAAFIAFAKSIVETGDALDELSERLGITVGQAQEFSIAAKLGGADVDMFALKFEKLRAALRSGAAKGDNPLAVFGIGATTDTASAIQQLATLIQTTGLNAAQATQFVEIFGRGSGKLINVLGDLKTAQGAMKFESEQVHNLKQASDWWTIIANNAKVMASNLFFASKINDQVLADRNFDPESGNPIGPPLDEEGILAAQFARQEAANAHMATQDRVLAIEKEIAKVTEENRVSGLSEEERRVDLAKQREAIFERIAKTEEERAQKVLDIQNNEKAMIGLSKKSMGGGGTIAENSLGRIGVFTGAASSISHSTVTELREIKNALISRGILVKDTLR